MRGAAALPLRRGAAAPGSVVASLAATASTATNTIPKGIEHMERKRVVRGARGRAAEPKGVEHVVGEVEGSGAAEALAAGAEGPGSGLLPGRNREQSDGCMVYIRMMSLVLCGLVKIW